MMLFAPINSLKKSKHLLRNRALRRKDPNIRQIVNGKVTKRWEYEVSRESLIAELKKDFEEGKPLIASPADVTAIIPPIAEEAPVSTDAPTVEEAIAPETIQRLDKAMENYSEGKVSGPVDIEKMQELAASIPDPVEEVKPVVVEPIVEQEKVEAPVVAVPTEEVK